MVSALSDIRMVGNTISVLFPTTPTDRPLNVRQFFSSALKSSLSSLVALYIGAGARKIPPRPWCLDVC